MSNIFLANLKCSNDLKIFFHSEVTQISQAAFKVIILGQL